MIKLILLIGLITFTCLDGVLSDDLCKLTGSKGKSPPDILSLIKGQSGYSGIIEIVETSSNGKLFTNQLKDLYDTSQQSGSIEWLNAVELSSVKSIHYYPSSLESFFINDDSTRCTTKGLAQDDKKSILKDWMSPEMVNIFDLLSPILALNDDHNVHLGPTLLMIMASTQSGISGVYKGQVPLDEFKVEQWSMCLSPSNSDLVVDSFFLANSNLPYRLVISSQSNSDKTKTLVNFLTFDPLLPKTDHILTFPIGHGCKRSYKYDNPVWVTTNSYLIDMEAAISFTQPDQLKLSTMKLIKYQNTNSYQIAQGDLITRIIKTPSLLQYFQVNPRTGSCTIDHEKSFFALTAKTVTTQWPLLEDDQVQYNLLSPELFTLEGTNFLGAIKTDFGTMHVFEKIVNSFFKNDAHQHVNCLVQFFFPEAVTHHRHESPHHLIIRPFSSSIEDETRIKTIPSRIEITYVDYQTDEVSGYNQIDSIDYADAFDVSGCYDEPGQYTWFQLVFPDTTLDIARYQERDSIIHRKFLTLIEPLIPLIRLPDIRVTIFGPNIYITCKLLQAETFNFISSQSTVLSNPTRLVVREYMEDCSELCLDSEYCSAFAHCGNMECFLFAGSATEGVTYESEHREDCTLYASASILDLSSKSQVEINLLKSSKNILHQLKRKLEQGQLVLPGLGLSAGDLFIINSPDEIGGVDEELPFGRTIDESSMGDDFQVLIPNQRFIGGSRTAGLNYKSCLALCANDDDCYTLSYCPAPTSECIIMNKTSDQVKENSKELSSYVDGCDILSKSFLSFYRKLPGRSLVLDAIATIPNVNPDECARRCSLSTDFDCQSFDYCPKVENNQDKKTESACFLHTLHVATDSAHKLDGTVWDFGKAGCDHHSRKLSKDYQHYLGHGLSSDTHILRVKQDVSLENCAFQCNDLTQPCMTFEYCESADSSFTSTCRLTNYVPSGYNDNKLESSSSTSSSSSSLCSVYVNKKSHWRSRTGHYDDEVEGGLGMAIALGAFFFISAFAIGTIASHLYIKKYS